LRKLRADYGSIVREGMLMKNLVLTSVTLFCLLMLTGSATAAGEKSKKPLSPTEAVLKIEKNNKVIKYCPDNTCDIIKAPLSIDERVFEDFTVLFFSYASGYIYLEKSYDGKVPYRHQTTDKVKDIIARQRNGCEGEELAVVSCIMQRLAKDYKIEASFSRFDESKNVITPYDPQVAYSLKSLRKTQAWYKEQ
jgi:hypothetical protein